MEFCGKLIANGITKDKLYQSLDTLSKLCEICDDNECKTICPMRCDDDTCLLVKGQETMHRKVATIYDSSYINNIADMLKIKVDESFNAVINGKAESCMLCHDGMHYKGEETPSPKLLGDIITGAVRIVR